VEFQKLGSRNRNNKFPTILLTDGNQRLAMIIFIVLMRPIKFFHLGDTKNSRSKKSVRLTLTNMPFQKINFL
jgi:hypothetical protein